MPDVYRPLPPFIRRFNEIAQFVGSLSLIASVAVIAFFFFFGTEETAGYRFDRKHGWVFWAIGQTQISSNLDCCPMTHRRASRKT